MDYFVDSGKGVDLMFFSFFQEQFIHQNKFFVGFIGNCRHLMDKGKNLSREGVEFFLDYFFCFGMLAIGSVCFDLADVFMQFRMEWL